MALLGQEDFSGLIGMSVISPDLICSITWLTCSSYFWPSAETLPRPTPPDLMSKTVSVPPLKEPSCTALAVSNTATSTFFSALDAAKEKGVVGIGVDADLGYLGAHILSSALKKVDVAVFNTVKAVQDGSFKGGTDTIFDVKSGGVGYGKLSADASKYEDQLKQVEEQIKSGEITDIPSEVK